MLPPTVRRVHQPPSTTCVAAAANSMNAIHPAEMKWKVVWVSCAFKHSMDACDLTSMIWQTWFGEHDLASMIWQPWFDFPHLRQRDTIASLVLFYFPHLRQRDAIAITNHFSQFQSQCNFQFPLSSEKIQSQAWFSNIMGKWMEESTTNGQGNFFKFCMVCWVA